MKDKPTPWIAKCRCPGRELLWVGTFEARGREEAKREARRFVSSVLPLDAIIVAIAPGRVTVHVEGEEVPMDEDAPAGAEE